MTMSDASPHLAPTAAQALGPHRPGLANARAPSRQASEGATLCRNSSAPRMPMIDPAQLVPLTATR
jgi:hypothetical protein